MRKKKVKRVTRPIVIGHLEKISSGVFERYPEQITAMIKGNYGVYALYRRDKLYYIGMATDFRRRLNKHLRDRLKGKWNQFSLYLIRKTDHLREVESLLLRITTPAGNKVSGKLKRSIDLQPKLKRIMAADSKKVIEEILGTEKLVKKKARKRARKAAKGARPLKGYFPKGKMIYTNYKGKDYKAWVYGGGTIKIIPSGELFNSPSMAGISVTKKKTMNGWRFWKYKDKNGELVYIDQLRKKRG